jgi:hypothetical protein
VVWAGPGPALPGDDRDLPVLAAGVLQAHAGITVEDFEGQPDAFLRGAQHPTLGRGYLACAYVPMVELLGYLEANGFANYIASGVGATSCGRSARRCTASPASG